jgi:hypothetical protein
VIVIKGNMSYIQKNVASTNVVTVIFFITKDVPKWSNDESNTTVDLIVLSMKIYIGIYTHSLSVSMDLQKRSIRKTLVGHLRIVGKSVGNKFTNGFTKRQNMPKKLASSFCR